jgi:cell division protease FtsH
MPNISRNILIWLAIGFGLMLLAQFIDAGSEKDRAGSVQLAYSEFIQKISAGDISDVTIKKSVEDGTQIQGHFSNSQPFHLQAIEDPTLPQKLQQAGVKISAASPSSGVNSFWGIFLSSWLPFLLLIAVYIFFMRQMQSGGSRGGGGAMGFGKSRARLLTEHGKQVTFDDVAGIEEAKEELSELVDFLKNPGKFQKLGGKIPRGCLLVGPPGTGKTLLARAIAGEADVPFFSISGSDFVEMFVGVGASRVRDMFEQGKKNSPCIIFIDEIDAVGRHRGAGVGGGNDEREQTLNQLLVEMDGFEENESVILIAATNRPDVLDPALLRPGRFDRQIVVPNPDIDGRTQILQVHLRKVPIAPDVDAKIIARGTPGFSGADLANLVNEAALLAARQDKKVVTMRELEAAKDKVMMGAERKSMVLSEEEKRMTAFHEAGHAIVSLHFPASDPIHKATIIPRGRALGMVMRLPESDKVSYKRDKMYADLAVSMGGRVAEELVFGYDQVSSGASSDIQYATKLARAMVAEWGMSDKMGPIHYAQGGSAEPFFGQSMSSRGSSICEATAAAIDREVHDLVMDAHKQAKEVLETNRHELDSLAEAMLEYETLSGDEIKALLKGEKIIRNEASDTQKKPARSSLPSSRDGKADADQASGDA